MPQPILPITADRADRIFRILVAFANADATQRMGFIHQMSYLGQIEYRITSGYYGPKCFWIDNDLSHNEWYVTPTNEDETTHTRGQVDETNLQLALLRDSELP